MADGNPYPKICDNRYFKATSTMNIIETINNKYKSNPLYGIQFSIEPSAYDCDREVELGDNTTYMQCGMMYNYQDVLLDGKPIGFIEERQAGTLFDPMVVSFCITLCDWDEVDKLTDDIRNNPHFHDAVEAYELRFATLKQLIDYYDKI